MDVLESLHSSDGFSMPTALAKQSAHQSAGAVADGLPLAQHHRVFGPHASIILIGIRAAGKRSLGFIAAAQLGRRFISESLYFKEDTGLSETEYFRQHGTKAFKQRHLEVLSRMLEQNSEHCVIECGTASLSQRAREILKLFSQTHPIVQISRSLDHVCQLAGLKHSDVHHLRKAELHDRWCSNLEFYNLYDPSCRSGTEEADFSPSSLFILRDVKFDFQVFVRLTTGKLSLDRRHPASISAVALEERSYTYAATLRMSDLVHGNIILDVIESGEDAIEFKIDILVANMLTAISKYVAQIRRRNPLPLIYTVDAAVFGGPAVSEADYFELIDHGLRLGAEYVQVELSFSRRLVEQVISNKGYSKIIGAYHFDSQDPGSWLYRSRLEAYEDAKQYGVDIVRFTQKAVCRQDNTDVKVFSDKIARGNKKPALIAYNTGPTGKTSMVFNRVLTPVKLPSTAVQGDSDSLITSHEATQALFKCFELDRLQFHMIGEVCGADPAPSIYDAVFRNLGLDHGFAQGTWNNMGQLHDLIDDPSFGGCIVGSSRKGAAWQAVQSRSKHATAIGAVNTILPLRPGIDGSTPPFEDQSSQRNRAGPVAALHGENTEWIGITNCLHRKLSPRNAAHVSRSSAVVIGAGGTARAATYALIHLGYQNIFIYNRTTQRAQELANDFNATQDTPGPDASRIVQVLPYGFVDWDSWDAAPTCVMFCVPAEAINESMFPDAWLRSSSGGVVGDVSYGHSYAQEKTKKWRQRISATWDVFNGFDMLIEHGSIQFELLTGRRAPVRLLRKLLMEQCHVDNTES